MGSFRIPWNRRRRNSRLSITDELLGTGCNGTVVKRGSLSSGTDVAVKMIQLPFCSDREAEIMRKIDHPNVLKLLHVEDDDNFRYYAFEMCLGPIDRTWEETYRGPSMDEVDSLYQMARGLGHLHRLNIVHRDIKPSNILVAKASSCLKISDFGVSKMTSDEGSFSLSGIEGTVNYMAPELLNRSNGGQVDRASNSSDVFSLGVVFFKFLTKGKHPFLCNGSDVSIPHNILKGFSDLSALSRDHFAFLLITKMIQPEPHLRPKIQDLMLELRCRGPKSPPVVVRQKPRFLAQSGIVHTCRFHPTKSLLACAEQNKVHIYECNSRVSFNWPHVTLETTSQIQCLEWRVDGAALAAGCSDGTTAIWKETGRKLFQNRIEQQAISILQWNRQASELLLISSCDKRVVVWDSKRRSMEEFQTTQWITNLCWTSTNKFAIASWDGAIHIVQIDCGSILQTFNIRSQVSSLFWNPIANMLASFAVDGTLKLWDSNDNKLFKELTSSVKGSLIDWHYSSSRTKSLIACAGGKNSIFVWELNEGAAGPKILNEHSDSISSIAFSPIGEFLSALDFRGELITWSTKNWDAVSKVKTAQQFREQNLSWNVNGGMLALTANMPEALVFDVD